MQGGPSCFTWARPAESDGDAAPRRWSLPSPKNRHSGLRFLEGSSVDGDLMRSESSGLLLLQRLSILEGDDDLDTQQVRETIQTLKLHEEDVRNKMEDFDSLYRSRRTPLERDLSQTMSELERAQQLLQDFVNRSSEDRMPPPRGPKYLSYVDSSEFAWVSNGVLVLNFAVMIFSASGGEHSKGQIRVLDDLFLTWYVLELLLKCIYHGSNLFIGKLSLVWWNWMDLAIVIGGSVEQWLVPLLVDTGGGLALNTTAFRCVRLLRLFRLLRVVRVLRAAFRCDASWAKSEEFDVFVSGVVAVNAVVMSVELDYDWGGWVWVDNSFLSIYLFELWVRVKHEGMSLFLASGPTGSGGAISNWLDLAMVVGGVMELWVLPLHGVTRALLNNEEVFWSVSDDTTHNPMLYVLKLTRIARVLRFLRLVRAIKPLHRLLQGVMASLKAMQWVVILVFMMLYMGAIFWTSLVGKGLIYPKGELPDGAVENFGTVPKSLFSLFRLMNGDTDVVHAITGTIVGQLIFASFMVIANWAVLAILTSVVSDNMITASHKAFVEDQQTERVLQDNRCSNRLRMVFEEVDERRKGYITEDEWEALLADPGLCFELQDATSMQKHDIREIFQNLAVTGTYDKRNQAPRCSPSQFSFAGFKSESDDGAPQAPRRTGARTYSNLDQEEVCVLHYDSFIELMRNVTMPADRRCVLQILAKMQQMERHMEAKFNRMFEATQDPTRKNTTWQTRHERQRGSVLLDFLDVN